MLFNVRKVTDECWRVISPQGQFVGAITFVYGDWKFEPAQYTYFEQDELNNVLYWMTEIKNNSKFMEVLNSAK